MAGIRVRLIALWLAAGTLAFLLCLTQISGTLADGVFVPGDHDSFYHARRILAAIHAPWNLIQFDPNIHAPEGSWVTWPWGYDMMMAALGSMLMRMTGISEPLRVLAFVAPAWVFVNLGLLLASGSTLTLRPALLVLVALGFVLSPLTHALHRVGMLDHHFVEWSFVLAVLWLGLRWFTDPGSSRRASLCAAVLGAAPAFHNGLFILQLPLLATIALLWLGGHVLPRRACTAFAFMLVLATFAFLLPSAPFRDGQFSFYLQSWFHLYVAGASALAVVALSRLSRSKTSVVLLVAGGIALALPIVPQMIEGATFISGSIIKYEEIIEVQPPLRSVAEGDFARINQSYSALVWLLPAVPILLFAQLRLHRSPADLFFLVMTLFGSALLVQQFRLQYFGWFAIYLGWCVIVERGLLSRPHRAGPLIPALLLVLALTHIAPLRALGHTKPLGEDFQYMLLRNLYLALEAPCVREPGVVLAEHSDGHYITFHSACAVIADNFILTPQHERKVVETDALLRGTLADVRSRAPYVRYILVRRADNVMGNSPCALDCPENAGLRAELLADPAPTPPGLTLLAEQRIERRGRIEPLGRLFAIDPIARQ